VYVGLYGAEGNFQAWLSDFSAPAYVDTTLSDVFGNSYAVYTLTYAAASANQHLNVRYRSKNLFDLDFGNVTLQAATLVQNSNSQPAPVTLLNPAWTGQAFSFSFLSQSGRTYDVSYTDALGDGSWPVLATLTGTGSRLSFTNNRPPATQRFYRVGTK
jgi:hypothetical protein